MRLILIALDGLRPDLVQPQTMPRLSRLAAEGARFADSRSVFPSETRCATPSFSTGCRPGEHGMVANTFYAPEISPKLIRTKHLADIALLAPPGGSPLQRPSLGEILAANGRSFALVSAGTPGAAVALHPMAGPLGAFRWNVEDTAGEAAALVRARLGETPPAGVPNIPRCDFAAQVLTDVVLDEMRPDVALLWCSEPDVSFHYRTLSSPETLEALACADRTVGRVLDWRDAQPDAADIVVMVLSDHGHVTGTTKLSVAAALREAGFPAAETFEDGDIAVAPGAAPGLWFRNPGDVGQVAAWLGAQPWCGALFAREPFPGAEPLALLGSAHARSADIMMTFAGTEGPDAHGYAGTGGFDGPDVPVGGGMHGGLHRAELATVLVMQGGPIRQAVVVRQAADLTDIAPTVLHLLGLTAPSMAGRPRLGALEASADAAPDRGLHDCGRGFVLETMTQDGRLYPTAMRRAV
ncbi:putative AlkP superfamily pyrophosphatase or phosphodiesterase [Humitalea rosea]|uniref:Putative AlkP superfamily pyrophosphatase or phosphodiesterase n=1 Tax=Humitalea rosea TaxID=990373 RepID=A0A2W7I8S8_9PROT|nr:alkaline phosphatase family protein [Humitalea rosea]PZW43104.1 putative AlkP superfamily pyrophosphatase or phosphodiesterase [Humitalea rosea]